MQTEIVIRCDKSPGVLARVIVALRRVNMNLTQQKMTETEDHRVIAIAVEGPSLPLNDLLNAIMAVPGVAEVNAGGVPEADEPTTVSVGEAANSPAVAIAQAFPDIYALVTEHRARLAPAQAPELMFALGVEVATLRQDTFAQLPETASISEFLETRVLPEIAGLGSADFSEDGLRVLSSIFTKPPKGQKTSGFGFSMGGVDTVERCDFLSGYVQGIMEVTPGMRYGHVEETMCRKEGQPYCLFRLEQN